MSEPVPGIQAVPDQQNARLFHVLVSGPKDVSSRTCILTWFIFHSFQPEYCGSKVSGFGFRISRLSKTDISSWNFFSQRNIPWRHRRSDS